MKRLSIVLLVLFVLVPATLSASMINLSLGATAVYGESFGAIAEATSYDGFSNIDNYRFGADLRLRILLAEIDAVAMFGKQDEYTDISMLATAGISLDLLDIIRIGAGIGPRFNILVGAGGELAVKDVNGDTIENIDSAGEAFLKSPLAYRLTADIKLGNILVGLNYTLDTEYTFENYDQFDKIFAPKFDDGAVGISVLYSFF